MLGTIGFDVGPLTRMALNIAMTTLACLLSYQLLVRHTLVGVLLNGKRQAKRAAAGEAVAAEPK